MRGSEEGSRPRTLPGLGRKGEVRFSWPQAEPRLEWQERPVAAAPLLQDFPSLPPSLG